MFLFIYYNYMTAHLTLVMLGCTHNENNSQTIQKKKPN